MKNVGKSSAVPYLVALVIMILGVLGNYFVPRWLARNQKELTIEIQNNIKIFPIENRIRPYLADLEKNGILNRLNLITLRFINTGERGIAKKDFIREIDINFPDNYRLFETPRISDNPTNVEVMIKKDPQEDHVFLSFDLLNKKQYFTCDILYLGETPIVPSIIAKILDLDNLSVRTQPTADVKERKLLSSSVSTLIDAFMLSIILLSIYIYEIIKYGKLRKGTSWMIYIYGGLIVGIVVGSYFYLIGKSFFSTFSIILSAGITLELIAVLMLLKVAVQKSAKSVKR
ncbi:MAG: hypothetical protein WCC00_12695 [Candidatus Aminicenantales bacterium]